MDIGKAVMLAIVLYEVFKVCVGEITIVAAIGNIFMGWLAIGFIIVCVAVIIALVSVFIHLLTNR